MPFSRHHSDSSTGRAGDAHTRPARAWQRQLPWATVWAALLPVAAMGCGSTGGDAQQSGASSNRSGESPSSKNRTSASRSPSRNSREVNGSDVVGAPYGGSLEVAADAYADIPQAIDALVASAEQGEMETRNRATRWLMMQGAAAVPPLADLLLKESNSDASRLAACRALGGLGAPAEEPLVAAIAASKGDSRLVRVGAVVELSHVRPVSPSAVATLLALVDDDDLRVRQMAIRGLGSIGPEARSAVERLVGLLNSDEDEVLRSEAKQALLRIDPRRRLDVE